jgi:hypothetical protein
MAKNLDDLIPSADDVMKKIALAEAEKAAESFRKHAQVEAEKKAEMARLAGPSGLSEDEKIQLAAKVIRRAIDSGRTEMLAEGPDRAACIACLAFSPNWPDFTPFQRTEIAPPLTLQQGSGASDPKRGLVQCAR